MMSKRLTNMDSTAPAAAVAENLTSMKNEWGRVIADALGTPLILREILEGFSNTELLELSLVNKRWLYEARSVMKSRDSFTALLSIDKARHDIKDFASDLRRMTEGGRIVPFSGLTLILFNVEWNRRCWCKGSPRPSTTELAPAFQDILEQIPWKHLTVIIICDERNHHQNCPAIQLAKAILKKSSCVLQEFALKVPHHRPDFIQQVVQDCSFPRLKTLKFLDYNDTAREEYSKFIKVLVSRAPNLHFMYTKAPVILSDNLLEGSSAVHISKYPCYALEGSFTERTASACKMKGLSLTFFPEEFSPVHFIRIMPICLQVSRTALNYVVIQGIFLVPFMCYGVCLENVRTLSLYLNFDRSEIFRPDVWKFVKTFDFARIFPKLSRVGTVNSRQHFQHIEKDFTRMLADPQTVRLIKPSSPDRAANIKRLNVGILQQAQKYSSTLLLAQMFPDIEKLDIVTHENPFASVWDSWVNLKEMHVKLYPLQESHEELDSVFCGIFPQEVAFLGEQDEDYLRHVNIVPAIPSITCFKELRTFKLDCYALSLFDDGVSTKEPIRDLLTQVTGLIAFQRSPNLTVTLTTHGGRHDQALSKIKPYAPVVPYERRPLSSWSRKCLRR